MAKQPLKIAIMMRPIDQTSAFQSFVEGLVEKMLQIDEDNKYLLIYRTKKWFGRFSNYSNAKEIYVTAPHKFLWDQVAVPIAAWREHADIIYNPKFSVPLISHCPVAMGLQEMAWRIWPQYYERLDVLYQKIMFPMFCRKARHFFPWSRFQLDEISGYLKRKLSNASITPPAVPDKFHIINDSRILKEYQIKYNLPDKFIFAVTRVDHPGVDGSSSFFPGKNVDTTVKAYIRCKKKIPHELVIAGRRVREYLAYRGFSERDLSGIRFLGFVPHDHLPMLFNLAQLFIMPSLLEGFGLTLLEAMACGCPAIVSKTGSCPELGGEAVILADPCDPTDFSEKITHVLGNVTLRGELQQKGLERASFFIWERSARLTIEGLTFAAGKTAV